MRLFFAMLGSGLALSAVSGAQAYHRFWVNCNYDAPTFMTTMTRDAAQDYANAARYEGYQWGGGCWNYDDVDSYPNDPPQETGTHGEGGDCSGLTFKTWRESTDDWRDGRYYWRALRNVHGPYTAADFRRVRRTEPHGPESDGRRIGRVRQQHAHRHGLHALALRRRSDRRGEVRGLRNEHLLPDVSQRLCLRRCRPLGLDRLTRAGLALLVLLATACSGGGGRPERLLDGRPASHFSPVPNSVITAARVLEHADVDDCLSAADRGAVASDAPVAERVGVDGRSITFANRDGTRVYACDGGIDPTGERAPPWCGAAVGRRERGRLLDPRLDVVCVDRRRRPLAYAFVDAVENARWVGVRQDDHVELYEVLAGLPVRVATSRGIDLAGARAAFEIAQYDVAGGELVRETLEAAVAG
jgi:hypothetical protein